MSKSDCILHSTIKESEGVTVAVILDVVRGRHVCREARGGWERFGCDSAIAVESALGHRLAQSTGRCVRVVTWAGGETSLASPAETQWKVGPGSALVGFSVLNQWFSIILMPQPLIRFLMRW